MKRRTTTRDDKRVERMEWPAERTTFKQNGQRRLACRDDEPTTALMSSLSGFADLYRHHATVFARYCAEGRCTEKQLATIEALYIDGISQNELAGRVGVSAPAIESRIDALANKAPEFYRWWQNLNVRRRQSRGTLRSDQKVRSPRSGRKRG